MQSTISISKAKQRQWDVIIIGAGPAGGFLAYLLAQKGLRILLLEKNIHPRFKVCGACLAPQGVSILRNANILSELLPLSLQINSIQLYSRDKQFKLHLNSGLAISRSDLDSHIVTKAIEVGAEIIFNTKAEFSSVDGNNAKIIINNTGDDTVSLSAKVVVNATGLTNMTTSSLSAKTSFNSYIGIGVESKLNITNLTASTIYMTLADEGYIGATLMPNGKVDLAGAIAPRLIKECKGVKNAVRVILSKSNRLLDYCDLNWQGTPILTSCNKVVDTRYYAIGDACGYVEPFTGEGMTWALESAQLVAPIISDSVIDWQPQHSLRWQHDYQKHIGRSHRFCHMTKSLLRLPPFFKETALRVSSFNPILKLASKLNNSSLPSWIT